MKDLHVFHVKIIFKKNLKGSKVPYLGKKKQTKRTKEKKTKLTHMDCSALITTGKKMAASGCWACDGQEVLVFGHKLRSIGLKTYVA